MHVSSEGWMNCIIFGKWFQDNWKPQHVFTHKSPKHTVKGFWNLGPNSVPVLLMGVMGCLCGILNCNVEHQHVMYPFYTQPTGLIQWFPMRILLWRVCSITPSLPLWLWGEAFLNGYIDFSRWLEIGNLNHIPLENNLRQIKEWILHGRHANIKQHNTRTWELAGRATILTSNSKRGFPSPTKNHTTPPQFFGCNMLPTKTPTPIMLANIWITHQTCIKSVKAIRKNCWMVPLR